MIKRLNESGLDSVLSKYRKHDTIKVSCRGRISNYRNGVGDDIIKEWFERDIFVEIKDSNFDIWNWIRNSYDFIKNKVQSDFVLTDVGFFYVF